MARWFLVCALVGAGLVAGCDAGASPLDPLAMAAAGTSAAATSTALPALYLAATATSARGTESAADARTATDAALSADATRLALVDLGTRQAAEAGRLQMAATATAASLRASMAGTSAAVDVARARAQTAEQVDEWRSWAWAWTGVGAAMFLALAVVWRVGLVIEAVAALMLAGARSRMAEADNTRARTALITGAVTLLENPEFTARDNWRAQVVKFAERAEPLRFNERLMAEAGISYERSRVFASILQSAGVLVRTRAGSMLAGGQSLTEIRASAAAGKLDSLFPRKEGKLLDPPALL